MERVGIVVVAGIGIVSLAVISAFKTITDGVNDRDSLRTIKQRLAKGEITEQDYYHLRGILREKGEGR
jgi:uncharacterized membrane protein